MEGAIGVNQLTAFKAQNLSSNARLALICFVSASVGLPIAWISIAKVLVVFVGLGSLAMVLLYDRSDTSLSRMQSTKWILVALLAFATSLAWTPANTEIALLTLIKHSKLIVIPLLMLLISTEREARAAMLAFVAAQSFVLISSLLLAIGIPIPWVTDPIGKYVVFSSYLDQSIMLSTAAAVIWHLRTEKLWPTWLAAVLSVGCLVDALILLDGRTGYAVAITMVSLASMWAMPKRLRLLAGVLTPIILLGGLMWGSSNIQHRVSLIVKESQGFSQHVETSTSSGWRLNAWQRSAQAIGESPWHGHGVGSWALTVKRLQGEDAVQVFGEGNASNPHQEYLLWGVELGALGPLLFSTILLSMAADGRKFKPPIRRALWSVLAALAVACLFNSALYDDLMGDFFCVALGILLALGHRSTDKNDMASSSW
jgi:O-antigen ligase